MVVYGEKNHKKGGTCGEAMLAGWVVQNAGWAIEWVVHAEIVHRMGCAYGASYKSRDTDCTTSGTTHCHVRKKQ